MKAEPCVWGVDTGLAQTTICSLSPPASPRFAQLHPGDGDLAERLHNLGAQLAATVELGQLPAPLFVMVERPTGRFPNPGLGAAFGVVIERLYAALREANPYPTSLWAVPVSTWKKETVGRGNATKADVREWAAHQLEIEPTEDEADAFAIASYAQSRAMLLEPS